MVILFFKCHCYFVTAKQVVLLCKVALLQCLKVLSFIPKQLVLLFWQISLYAKACNFYCAPYVYKSEKMVSSLSMHVNKFQNSDT